MYRVQSGEHELDAVFSAELCNIDFFCKDVESFLTENGLDAEHFKVILGIREILTNAIRHGCGSDSEKKVCAGICFSQGEVILYAEDPGRGYDWEKMLSCPPGICTESGRGLCILQNYFSSLDFNQQGNKIVLRVQIGS